MGELVESDDAFVEGEKDFMDEELENLEHDLTELEDCLATCDVSELSEKERDALAAEAQQLGKRVSKYLQVRREHTKDKNNRGFVPKTAAAVNR